MREIEGGEALEEVDRVGFFASLALGLARLGLGLWGIRRLRMRSRPIDDRELGEAVEVLRAELGCTRPV